MDSVIDPAIYGSCEAVVSLVKPFVNLYKASTHQTIELRRRQEIELEEAVRNATIELRRRQEDDRR